MKILMVLMSVLVLTGCSTTLTPGGGNVEIVTEARKAQCTSLGIVTGSEMMGNTMAGDAESAMNKVRNRVAAKGGNGMFVISSTSTEAGTTVTAEALKCPPLSRDK